jgi:hypothetical protein
MPESDILKFTPQSLQLWLDQRQLESFVPDKVGGLRCGNCNLPAVYGTLHLSIWIKGLDAGPGVVTTRSFPVCRSCDGQLNTSAVLYLPHSVIGEFLTFR